MRYSEEWKANIQSITGASGCIKAKCVLMLSGRRKARGPVHATLREFVASHLSSVSTRKKKLTQRGMAGLRILARRDRAVTRGLGLRVIRLVTTQ